MTTQIITPPVVNTKKHKSEKQPIHLNKNSEIEEAHPLHVAVSCRNCALHCAKKNNNNEIAKKGGADFEVIFEYFCSNNAPLPPIQMLRFCISETICCLKVTEKGIFFCIPSIQCQKIRVFRYFSAKERRVVRSPFRHLEGSRTPPSIQTGTLRGPGEAGGGLRVLPARPQPLQKP